MINNNSAFLKLRTRLVLLFVFGLSSIVYGQLYNFTSYSMEDGLPQSTVFCIMEDSRGFLWVGTEGGAARFDGSNFEIFDRNNSLPGNIVRSIVQDAEGALWFGTDAGIAVYDGYSWKTISEKQGLQGTSIMKLLPDSQGRMWAATNDGGVNIVTQSDDSLYIENISSMQGLCGDFVFDILHNSDGSTWLALIGGISKINFINGKATIQNIGDSLILPSFYISSIEKDTEGNIWLGTLDEGAFLWKKNSSDFISYKYPNGVDDNRIWDIFCQPDGTVWFASEKTGIYYLKDNIIQNISSRNGLSGDQIFCLYADSKRNLWLGAVGHGLSLFNGLHFVHYGINDGLPGEQVLAVKTDALGQLWVGTNQRGLAKATFQNDKMTTQIFGATQGFVASDVSSIDFDNRGRLLAGTKGLGLYIYYQNNFSYISEVDGLLNDNINCVYSTKNEAIYVGSNMGFNEIKEQKIHSISEKEGLINSEVETVIADNDQNIWMGTQGGLAFFQAKTSTYRDFNEQEGLFDLGVNALLCDKYNTIWIGTNNGIYSYNPREDTIVALKHPALHSKNINSLTWMNDSTLIAGTNTGFHKINFDAALKNIKDIKVYDKANGFIWSETQLNAICKDQQNHIWFGTVNGLTCYRPEFEDTLSEVPKVHFKGIRLSFEPIDWEGLGYTKSLWNSFPDRFSFPYKQNHITIDFGGINFKNPEKVVYRYKLEPHENNWSPPTQNTSVTYPGLTDNEFTFSLIASADGVNWSAPITYSFTIRPPFWKTFWFIGLMLVFIALLMFFYIRWREMKLREEKEHLEKVVKERTAEVVAQKEEIEHQQEEITGSITYAQRIQRAVLPGIENLQQNTDDCFILFKPRDIVSGDFYWVERIENNLIVAAADCTGHGVPGAFMSMLGVSFMNKIIKEQKVAAPEIILAEMRANVIGSLRQGKQEGSTKDGMDMAICIVDLETLKLTFSGAYNPALIISDGMPNELKADRMPVGLHIVMKDYTPETIQLKKGDCVYMFSDGFQDQIGGPNERKFMRKNMRELLVSIHKKSFCEQHDILNTTIEDWRNHPQGKTDQMDDILVMGFKI